MTDRSVPDPGSRTGRPITESVDRPGACSGFRAEIAAYDREADVAIWDGPYYRMRHRTLGEGPTLLVCPGIASTYRVYARLLNRLADRFRTVVIEYPGDRHGDGADLNRIGHPELAGQVLGFLDAERPGPAFGLGLSFGSTVVLHALHESGGRCRRAVLQGGFAYRRFSSPERLALRLGRRLPGTAGNLPFRRLALAWTSRDHFPPNDPTCWQVHHEENALTPIASLAHRLDLLATLDLRSCLPAISSEVLAIHGACDRIIPILHQAELLRLLSRAQGLILDGVGHQIHLTHPDELALAITAFLLEDRALSTHPG